MLNFDDIQSTYRKQPPFTREFFNERIKPELNLFQDAAEELNYFRQGKGYIDNLVNQSTLRLRSQYCWIFGRHYDTHHGNAERWVFRFPLGDFVQDHITSNKLRRPLPTKFWDLIIPDELYDISRILEYGQDGPLFGVYHEFTGPGGNYTDYYYSGTGQYTRFLGAAGAHDVEDGVEYATVVNWHHHGNVPEAGKGNIAINSFSNNKITWRNMDTSIRSLTSNLYMQPYKNFNEADIGDPVKVAAFKETFKNYPGSPLKKIYSYLNEELRKAENNYASAKQRFDTLLKSLNKGLRASHFENKIGLRTWHQFTRAWGLAPISGEITVQSLRHYFDEIMREELSEQVKFFKGVTLSQNSFPRGTETDGSIVRVSPELIPIKISGTTKWVSIFGFKKIGSDANGHYTDRLNELVNPSNQQNIEIKHEHFVLATIWILKDMARLMKGRVGRTVHVGRDHLLGDLWWDQLGDEVTFQVPYDMSFHTVAQEARDAGFMQGAPLSEHFASDDPKVGEHLAALHPHGAGRNDVSSLYGLIFRLRSRLKKLYDSAFEGFGLESAGVGQEERMPNIRADGLTKRRGVGIWQTNVNEVYAETLDWLVKFGEVSLIEEIPEDRLTGSTVRKGLVDLRVCHSSCHGSCHGSRFRR